MRCHPASLRFFIALGAALLIAPQMSRAQDAGNDTASPSPAGDRTQPVHIKADRIEIDQKKSVTTYIGKVSFSQGGLKITADRAEARYRGNRIESLQARGTPVTLDQRNLQTGNLHTTAGVIDVRFRNNGVETVVATGNPVSLRKLTGVQADDLHATTLRLEYHAADNKVALYGEVMLKQGVNTVRCPVLHYNLAEDTLLAEGDESVGRINVMIQPKEPVIPLPGNSGQPSQKGQP